MPNVVDLKGNCVGCSACSSICPAGAITMHLGGEGFFEPLIERDKCINCGLCQKVCVKKDRKFEGTHECISYYSAFSLNEDNRYNSTSGGVAYEMYRYAIENGFYVTGCVYDRKQQKAILKVTNNLADLRLFQQSKYLQSDAENALREAIALAKQGKNILYIGTPCQVYGAKQVTSTLKLDDKFIFVDFYCHGVPSYLLWNKHLSEVCPNKKNIIKVSFRDKTSGWHNPFNLTIETDTEKYRKNAVNDNFYNFYFDNVCFQKSCYNCCFRKGQSVADIKIGDFWGRKFKSDKNGVSIIRTNSKKGDEFLKTIKTLSLNAEENEPADLGYQSSADYKEIEIRDFCINTLKTDEKLRKIRKQYRKHFSFRRRFKLKIKRLSYNMLPNKIYDFLRKRFI